jgi:hypothetical protein
VFAASVLVIDLPSPPGRPVVRGVFAVPPVRPARATPVVDAFDAAAARVVGESGERWTTRTGARRYLPDLIARAFRESSGADAAFVPPAHHGAQAPLDGVMAELPQGPVTDLDLVRLFPAHDYGPVVVELEAGELDLVVARHAAIADPAAAAGDDLWWNWCRMPAAVSVGTAHPASVAVVAGNVPLLSLLLDRELTAEPAPVGARDALALALQRTCAR